MHLARRVFIFGGSASALAAVSSIARSQSTAAPMLSATWQARLIAAARSQIGVTVIYDPSYVGLSYPGGDVARERGVCTDVIIRAYRDAFAVDLQVLVHEDMKANFSAYPTIWGHTGTDRNIDHRRVPNLETFLTREGAALPVTDNPEDYRPGDLVTQRLPGNLPHIAIVSDRHAPGTDIPLMLHNVGRGAREENILLRWPIHGHFRFVPEMA